MKKEIKIDGQTLALSANAATPIRFKMTFGEDLLKELSETERTTELPDTVAQLTYIMAKQATGETSDLSFENYLSWLEKIGDPTAFLQKSAEIIKFYLTNVKTGSKAKNPSGPRTEK